MIDIGDALAWGPALPLVRIEGRIRPLVAFDLATDDEATLRRMLAETRAPIGVGIVASAARLVVIDVDHPSKGHGDGAATMRELQARICPLPLTRTHRTKSGGWQLVFEAPAAPVRSAQRELRGAGIEAPGVDIVAGHAMLRWPPTLGYTIARNIPSARLPTQWVAALRDRVAPAEPAVPSEPPHEAYARVALERVTAALSQLGGDRNVSLNAAAYRLGRMCPPLDKGDVVAALVGACELNGSWKEHGSRSCLGSIKRGLRAGERRPLRLIAHKVSPVSAGDGVLDLRGNQDGYGEVTGTDRRARPLDRSPHSPSAAISK